MRYYHGTTAKAARAILKEGLKPRKGPGDDAIRASVEPAWGRKVMEADAAYPGRADAVYITTNKHTATLFAGLAARFADDKPAILEITLPKSERVIPDPYSEPHLHAFEHIGPIPPECIRPVSQSHPQAER